jgi:FSR family fosmidomycin resistance protein-like MFS transporter
MGTAMVLGLVHAVVDAASLAILYAEANRGRLAFDRICQLFLLYNCIAFGLQFPVGLVADRFHAYKSMALGGLAGAALALGLAARQPQLATVTVAMGNALFHVGAGALVLQCSRGRAAAPGVFVAPGALGVLLGIWLGTGGFPFRWCLGLAVIASAFVLLVYRAPPPCDIVAPDARLVRAGVWVGVSLLFMAIAVRSLVGDAVAGCWRGSWTIGLTLTLAAIVGKALGGVVADRLGWRACAVGALLLLTAFARRAFTNAPAAALAMFLIQTTTGLTLAAVFVGFPTRPGAVFGFCSAALLVGAMPGLAGFFSGHDPTPMLVPLVSLAALAIFVGLSFVTGLRETQVDWKARRRWTGG